MTDQKPTGVFVRLPLSDEQIKAADQIAKEIAENNAENEWRFARHHFLACDELAIALGTPVVAGELPIVTTLGTLRDPVPCVCQSDAQGQIAARDAEIVRKDAQVREYRALLEQILNKASLSCVRTLSGRESRLLAAACADAREALKGGAA